MRYLWLFDDIGYLAIVIYCLFVNKNMNYSGLALALVNLVLYRIEIIEKKLG